MATKDKKPKKKESPSIGSKSDARDSKGRFTAGNSCGGRKKLPDDLKEAFQAHSMDAMETLVEVMEDKKQPGSVRIKAAEIILDRAWGKPSQEVQLEDNSVKRFIIVDKMGGDYND